MILHGRDKCVEVQPNNSILFHNTSVEGVHGTLPMQPSGDTS